jgi:hypothetical protein
VDGRAGGRDNDGEMLPLHPLFAASVPSWVWATLLMALFVVVSVATMLLARYPVRRAPPAIGDEQQSDAPKVEE